MSSKPLGNPEQFSDLRALFINCSLKPNSENSHTMRLLKRAAGIMITAGAKVEIIHALDHDIPFGMEKDLSSPTISDDWPKLQTKIMTADILVIGTPIWLGAKSSVANLVIERMYAFSGEHNDKDQYLYYGKTAGCIITGNEDGAKACASEILYAMAHIGYTVPPQADAAWLGAVGPGPSYGDTEFAGQPITDRSTPVGYDSDFTNRNTTFMAWNLLHMARMLKDHGGITAHGNTSSWREAINATQQLPE